MSDEYASSPRIIQGGMGVAVSGWPLARAVALTGQLGVVSGTDFTGARHLLAALGNRYAARDAVAYLLGHEPSGWSPGAAATARTEPSHPARQSASSAGPGSDVEGVSST